MTSLARRRDASPAPDPRSRRGWFRVGQNVYALGMTSLVTDVSSEMVTAILPIYLAIQLGLSPLAIGVYFGLAQGVTGVMRIAGGVVADRLRRHKEVAGVGYAVSVACRLGLLAVPPAAVPVEAVLVADRLAKGVRSAPRDALISLSAPAPRLAEAFGVHRAMDTVGAFLGPFVAYLILEAAPGAHDAVFVTSFLVGLLGLGIFVTFVRNPTPQPRGRAPVEPSLRGALHLVRDRRFRLLLFVGALLGLAVVGDALVYLAFHRRIAFDPRYITLLPVATALAYLLLAVPLGRLADRIGRGRVFVGGYLALAGVYALLLAPVPGPVVLVAGLALLGVFHAATDGTFVAMTSAVVSGELRTSGIAVVTTATALTGFAASTLFGAWWSWHGPVASVALFLGLLVVALAVAALALRAATPAREPA